MKSITFALYINPLIMSEAAKVKRPARYLMLLLVLAAVTQVSCFKNGDLDPADQPNRSPLVTVLYPPDGLGDRSYNDLIYQGVEEAALESGLRTLHLSPVTADGGRHFLESAIAEMSAAADTVRRLLIVAGTLYDGEVRQNSARLDANPRADLLYLETRKPLDDKGSTLYIPYYGAMYAAGAIAPVVAPEVLLVGANPKDTAVSEAMQGFSDGFRTRHVEVGEEKRLVSRYLAGEPTDGFSVADSTALRIMKEVNEASEASGQLLVPICRGAANTFYRLCDLIGGYEYVGVDRRQTSSRCHFSVVKHIDRAVSHCILQWLSGEGMPKHQTLGMADGYTEVIVHPYGIAPQAAFNEKLPGGEWESVRAEAIKKEAEHEK